MRTKSASRTITAGRNRSPARGGADLSKMVRPPVHPGEVLLKEYLEPLGYGAQSAAADAMGISRNRMNEIVQQRRPVTPESAILIGAVTGTSPQMWMHLQANRDLWFAMQDLDVSKIQPLKKAG